MTLLALCMTASRRRGSLAGKIAWIVRERGRLLGDDWEAEVEDLQGMVAEGVIGDGSFGTDAWFGCEESPMEMTEVPAGKA